MWWAAAVAHQVVTPVSPGASRHMLTAEAVVWKERRCEGTASGNGRLQLEGDKWMEGAGTGGRSLEDDREGECWQWR